MNNEHIDRLVKLIRERNRVEEEISAITGRPGLIGHVGEYIASRLFDIELAGSASQRSIDGRFRKGPLAGKTVNIKWYAKRENILDLVTEDPPDYYLVMTGPKASLGSSRGRTRPWRISSVFLFKTDKLMEALSIRGVHVGIATSVAEELWGAAELSPKQNNGLLRLCGGEAQQLRRFG